MCELNYLHGPGKERKKCIFFAVLGFFLSSSVAGGSDVRMLTAILEQCPLPTAALNKFRHLVQIPDASTSAVLRKSGFKDKYFGNVSHKISPSNLQ